MSYTQTETTLFHSTTDTSSYRSSSSTERQSWTEVISQSYIFPLFNDISRVANLPNVLIMILFTIIFVQTHVCFLWLTSNFTHVPEDSKFAYIMQFFCDFGLSRRTYAEALQQYIAGFVCYLIFAAIIAYGYFDYRKNHIFKKWMLYSTKIIVNLLIPLFLPVYSSLMGRAFIEFYADPRIVNIILLLFSVFFTVSLYQVMSLSQQFLANTSILSHDILSVWSQDILPDIFICVIMANSLPVVLNKFAFWLTPAAIIVNLLLLIKIITCMPYMPFIKNNMNILILSAICTGCISVVITFIRLFVPISLEVVVIGLVPLSLVALVISYIYYKVRINKITRLLSYASIGEEGCLLETTKREHFDTFVFSSTKDAVSYLRIGLMNHCELLVDFSFPHYLIEDYAAKEIVFAVCQVMSFFPTELQYFSYCLSLIGKMKNLTIGETFMYLQMSRINMSRQSSLNEDHGEIKKLARTSMDVIEEIRSFWKEIANSKTDVNFQSLRTLRELTMKTDTAFMDLVEKYPNSQALCQAYMTFALDGLGDIQKAALWKRKAMLVEQGRHLTVDFCFRSFVNAFPAYLYNNIVDIHGKVIMKECVASSSSSSSLIDLSAYDTTEYSDKLDELIGKMCDNSKLLIAIRASLDRRSMTSLARSGLFTLLTMLGSVVFFTLQFFLVRVIDSRSTVYLDQQFYLSNIFISVQKIGLVATGLHAEQIGYYSGLSWLSIITGRPVERFLTEPSSHYLQENASYLVSLNTSKYIRDLMASLLQDVNTQSKLLSRFSTKKYQYRIFKGGVEEPPLDLNLKSMINAFSDSVLSFASTSSKDNLHEIIVNSLTISKEFVPLMNELTTLGETAISTLTSFFIAYSLVILVVIILLLAIFMVKNTLYIFKDMHNLTRMMKKVKPEMIKESSKSLDKDSDRDYANTSHVHAVHQANTTTVLYVVVMTLSAISILSMFVVASLDLIIPLKSVSPVYSFLEHAAERHVAVLRFAPLFVAGNSGLLTQDEGATLFQEQYDRLTLLNEEFTQEIIGYENSLDLLHFSDVCPAGENDLYADHEECISLDRQVLLILQFVIPLTTNYRLYNTPGCLDVPEYSFLLYLIDSSMEERITAFENRLYVVAKDEIVNIKFGAYIYFSIGIAASIIIYVLAFIMEKTIYLGFAAIKQMIFFLPAKMIIKNRALMQFILNNKENKELATMTLAESVISNSTSAVVVIGPDHLIDSINPAAERLTGYDPSMLLGQHISFIIPPPSAAGGADNSKSAQFYRVVSQMTKNIGDKEASLEVPCLTANKETIIVSSSVLCTYEGNNLSSIVIILKDKTEQNKALVEANREKEVVETLLMNRIPKQLQSFVKNQAETVFSVDHATAIFIDIRGLPDLVYAMGPKSLMSVLNKVHNKIDEIRSTFTDITSISSYENVFVGCCGLFAKDMTTQQQVDVSIKFCSAVIHEIGLIQEETGLKPDVRVGMNVGGPVAYGMVNFEKPNFEFFGSFVGLAKKCMDTAEANAIQVCEAVVEALQADRYVVTPMRTIEGKKMYSISEKDK